jgi:ABC-2 type transport system permease protein
MTAIDVTTPALPVGRYRVRNVMRAEVAKILSLPSTLWMLIISVAGSGLVTFLSTNSALHHSPDWYQGFDATQTALIGLLIPALILGVFGALTLTSEYASGSIRVSMAATPRRPLLLAAKLSVAAIAVFAVAEALSFASFWFGQAVLSGGGAPSAHLGQPGVLRAVLLSGVCVALLALLSFGLGLIFRSTAGALAGYAGVAFVLPLILRAMPGREFRYAPTSILTNSVMTTVNGIERLSPTIGLLLMISYTVAVLVAGAIIFVRRDA